MRLEIRQVISDETRRLDPKGTFTRNAYPGSRGGGYVKKNKMKTYLHGLEKEELLDIEQRLGVSLGNTDDSYWASKFIPQYQEDRDYVVLDTDNLEDYLTWKAGVASGFFAPSIEEIGMGRYINTTFYVYNPDKEQTKRQNLKQKKNQLGKRLATFEDNTDWLRCVAFYLGVPIYQTSSNDYFYNSIDDRKEKATTIEEIDFLLKVTSMDPQDLMYNYYVKRGRTHSLLVYNSTLLSYEFDGIEWGNTDQECIKKFSETVNQASFEKLKQEVDRKERNK